MSPMNPTEAVYGFVAWLTTRQTPVTMSRAHDSAEPAELLKRFCETNKLDSVRDGIYLDNIAFPSE